MKIGILTFHNAHNYGAVLQAYALKTLIKKRGYQVDIINYCNQTIETKYQKILQCRFKITDVFHPGIIWYKLCYKRKVKYMQSQWTSQYVKFEEFINTYLVDMPQVKEVDIEKMHYDMLIVGSDQIWTEELTGGLDKVYVLDFPFEGRRISYGASSASGKIPKNEDVFIDAIKKFEFISTRERALAQDIEKKAKIRAEEVLDPTLLLNKEDYSELERKEGLPFIAGHYIFVYYVKEDIKLRECARAIAEKTEMEIVELHYYWNRKYDSGFQYANFGPGNFLAAIANAKFVVTNSFHGTVFSVLYRKKFYAVSQDNVRIQNLLANLGIMSRYIYSVTEINIDEIVSYNYIIKKLDEYRRSSIQFIEKAIS